MKIQQPLKISLFLLTMLLFLQQGNAQDYLHSKFRSFPEKVVIPFEHPSANKKALKVDDYYIDIYNAVDGACILMVQGFDGWSLPYTVCYQQAVWSFYDTHGSTISITLNEDVYYDLVLYVNEYEWRRISGPPYNITHTFDVSALNGFDIIISVEPFTGSL